MKDETISGPIGDAEERLRQAIAELKVLNDVATAVSASSDMNSVMQSVIERSVIAVHGQHGLITLVDEMGGSPSETLVRDIEATGIRKAYRLSESLSMWIVKNHRPFLSNEPGEDDRLQSSLLDPKVRSILCVPLLLGGRLIGILTIFNSQRESGFGADDQRLLSIIASQSATVIDAAKATEDRNRIVTIFGQHVPAAVVDLLLKRGSDIKPERREACVMFLDIRGYTGYAEHRQAEEVVAYLNAVFDFMIDIVGTHGGIVHHLLGDGFLAVFGAPVSTGNDVQSAFDAALEIIQETELRSVDGRIPPTRLSIGLHWGEVVAGTVGQIDRKEYMVTGDVVNVAARIEQANREFDSVMLISGAVVQALEELEKQVESVGRVQVRGRAEPVELYRVV